MICGKAPGLAIMATISAALTAFPAPPAAVAAELIPHQATYRVAVQKFKQNPGIRIEAGGVLTRRVTRDCQKWEVVEKFDVRISAETGDSFEFTSVQQFYEGLDGRRMEFSGWITGSGKRLAVKGNAVMNGDGSGGLARFGKPVEMEQEIPPGVRFPVAANREVLDALIAGRRPPALIAYRPLGAATLVETSPAGAADLSAFEQGDAGPVEGRSWIVKSRVQDMDETPADASFETMQIHENGVISRYWLDNPTTTTVVELVELRPLRAPDC